MAWRQIHDEAADTSGARVSTQWASLCADARRRIDPYLAWADLTGFRWTLAPGQQWLPFLVEVASDTRSFIADVRREIPECEGVVTRIVQVPAAYKRRLRADGQASRFFTAVVRRDHVLRVAAVSSVLRMKLGVARAEEVDSQTDAPPSAASPRLQLLQHDKEWPAGYGKSEYMAQPDPAAARRSVVLGVIDDGCNFAHPAYRAGGRCRVVRLWDQNQDAPAWAGKPRYFGYGRVMAEAEIGRALAGDRREREVYEAVYAQAPADSGQATAKARRNALLEASSTHGSAVLQLVAGEYQPLPQLPSAIAHGAPRPADSADVMFVQLPRDTVTDTTSSSLCVHALDAIRYIIDRAETYAPVAAAGAESAPQERVMRKVVINLSYGSMSGPHDGTAILDEAIEELVSVRGDLAIVVAAGNSRRSRCHAEMLLYPGEAASIGWSVAPSSRSTSVLETWIQGEAQDAGGGVELQLTDPHGRSSPWVAAGGLHALQQDGEDVAWIIAPAANAVGKRGRLALLALAPTSGASCAPHGLWRVELRSGAAAPVEVNFWVERNDMVSARVRRQQATLAPWDCTDAVRPCGTMCSPATSQGAVAVGARLWSSGEPAPYSGEGWERGKRWPDASAEVDLASCVGGLRVAGVVSGCAVRMSGTSAAAPIVARQLADWMAQQPQALSWDDIRAQLPKLACAALDGKDAAP